MKRFFFVPAVVLTVLQLLGVAATTPHKKTTAATSKSTTKKKSAAVRRKLPPPVDPTLGDNIDGDDLTIRRAAVSALGGYAGSVVVADPNTGRILTMVNQKL